MSERLLAPGSAHDRAPDKVPARRLRTIALAGKLGIPFTTGILIGIGETRDERVDALLAIRDLHERYGHIQEVIVQNFRAKPTHPDARRARARRSTTCCARSRWRGCCSAATMNIQAPPNLTPDVYAQLLAAGLNDWGGISPLTHDHINPEQPWPLIRELREARRDAGLRACASASPIYPEYADARRVPRRARCAPRVGGAGRRRRPREGRSHEHWRRW